MRDVELYRALLGLTAPWTVAGVDGDMKGQRVVVRVEPGPGSYPCPESGTAGASVRQQATLLAASGHDAVHDLD